jgi:beta-glucosidase
MKYTFPENFLWGTATAAHQIEGNNKNSDWSNPKNIHHM